MTAIASSEDFYFFSLSFWNPPNTNTRPLHKNLVRVCPGARSHSDRHRYKALCDADLDVTVRQGAKVRLLVQQLDGLAV